MAWSNVYSWPSTSVDSQSKIENRTDVEKFSVQVELCSSHLCYSRSIVLARVDLLSKRVQSLGSPLLQNPPRSCLIWPRQFNKLVSKYLSVLYSYQMMVILEL